MSVFKSPGVYIKERDISETFYVNKRKNKIIKIFSLTISVTNTNWYKL